MGRVGRRKFNSRQGGQRRRIPKKEAQENRKSNQVNSARGMWGEKDLQSYAVQRLLVGGGGVRWGRGGGVGVLSVIGWSKFSLGEGLLCRGWNTTAGGG